MNTVIGVFENIQHAERAAQKLISSGFHTDHVDISANRNRQRAEGGIGNFFRNLFGDGDEADNYIEMAERGCVVTVHATTMAEAEHAATILDEYGAINPNERALYYRNNPDVVRTDPYASEIESERLESTDREIASPSAEATLPIVEEQMKIEKKNIEKDRISIRSRIIERPVEENLRLKVEHVYVDRTPADRPATAADLETFKEGVIEATESEEIPMVKKEARVVEDITLRKEVEEKEKTIRESVRKQDVNVERKRKTKEEQDREDLI